MALAADDMEYVQKLVRKHSAIVLENDKEYLVEARLQNVARSAGLLSVTALITQLRATTVNGMHHDVVEAMTTNESSFFRDVHPFEALKKVVLPDLLQKRATESLLRIWCAACSTGQEPYTLAMLLREHFPLLNRWRVEILASDLSTKVLDRARQGIFSQLEVNRGLPAAFLVKYFQKQGVDWQIKDDIRKMVQFRQLNLIEPWPLLPPMEIVFVRNVLIYFDVETKKRILAKVRGLLRPDGYLFLGGAETTLNLDEAFERIAFERSGCYRLHRR